MCGCVGNKVDLGDEGKGYIYLFEKNRKALPNAHMSSSSAEKGLKGYRSSAADYYAKFLEKHGSLDFKTLRAENELYFNSPDDYVNISNSFNPATFEKYDSRTYGTLKIGDKAPNPLILPYVEVDPQLPHETLNLSTLPRLLSHANGNRPFVVNFGSYS